MLPIDRTRLPSTIVRPDGAVFAAAAFFAAAIAAIVLDAIAPGAGPLVQPLSSFAHTEYAWLWHLTIGAAATGLFFLSWTLRGRSTAPVFATALAVAGVGLAAAGVCAADPWFPWELPPTLSGGVHVAAVLLGLVAFTVAMTVRSRSLPPHPSMRWVRACEVGYLGSLVGAVAYLGAGAVAGRPPHLFGLWERLALGSALAWGGVLTVGALRPTNSWVSKRGTDRPLQGAQLHSQLSRAKNKDARDVSR